ncbi:MAG: hypothetical protein ACI9VT_002439 [Psychroserpens sp.]|jgi:IS1 family transposase
MKRGYSIEDWVPVLTLRYRSKHIFECVLSEVTTKAISPELRGKIEKRSVLCSDGFKAYIKFTQGNDLINKQLNFYAGIRVVNKVFHIQNVNAYHHRLKEWIAHFHGVASKYLEHYFGWLRLFDNQQKPNENRLFIIQ